jgi:hypothetical protein
MKNVLVQGLAAGLAMLIVSFVVGLALQALFPSLATEYRNNAVFLPWSDLRMNLMYVYPFVLGLVLAWAYSHVGKSIKGKMPCQKGMKLGMAYFVLATIPGMVITMASFQVSVLMVLSWTISALVQLLVGGVVVAKIEEM